MSQIESFKKNCQNSPRQSPNFFPQKSKFLNVQKLQLSPIDIAFKY